MLNDQILITTLFECQYIDKRHDRCQYYDTFVFSDQNKLQLQFIDLLTLTSNGTSIGNDCEKINKMAEVKHINENHFIKNKLDVKGLALVECFDKNLASLEIMKPILSKIKGRLNGSLTHLRAEITSNDYIANTFYALHIPTFLIFKDGELVDRIDGMLPYKEFMETIEKQI